VNSPRSPDARRLDVAAFASGEGRLDGAWPLAGMARLLQDALPLAPDSPAHAVAWSARGESRAVAGGQPQIRLHLQASTALRLSCQRCLQPMTVQLNVAPTLRFVQGEALAAQVDEESDEDVLALSPAVDLHELVEDELILALPLVPRHELCPQLLPMSAGEADVPADAASGAFAALAGLLKDGRGKPN
jgi:uncharacterized protein